MLFYSEEEKKPTKEVGYDNPIVKKLYSSWEKITRLSEEEGLDWKVHKKHIRSIEKNFMRDKALFIESTFRKGFTERQKLNISARQKISYEVLGNFFDSISFFKLVQ